MGIPTLKVNLLPTFPANVVGGAGISVNRTNAVYTIGLNYPGLSKISDVAPSEKPNTFVAVYDAPLNQYFTISFSDLTALISLPPPLSAIAGLSPAANTIAYYTGASTASLTSFNAFGRSVVGLTTANNGVMVTDGSGNPSISPALPAAVQSNISAVGTITSGTWNGTPIANANLATMPTLTIKSNLTGGTAAPSDNTVSAILDSISSTRGTVLYRGSATWAALAPGTLGTVLTSNGAGADPSYQAVGAGGNMANLTIRSNISGSTAPQADNTLTNIIDASFAASARGTILYRGASGWTALPPGTSGNVLTTNGPGADPAYVAFGINGPMAPLTIKSNITGSAATPADNTLNAVIAATGAIAIPDTTASTSTTTGALKVTGGVGVGGALNQGGDHTITKTSPAITLNDTGTGITRLASQRSGFSRWNLQLNDGALETGTGNAGSNFAISRFADNGALIDAPLTINRATGTTTFSQTLVVNGPNPGAFLFLDKPSTGGTALVQGRAAGRPRWNFTLGDAAVETGSGNTGSNFVITRSDDSGAAIDNPLAISRSTGQATFSQPLSVTTPAATDASVTLNKPASGTANYVIGRMNGVLRWGIAPGDSSNESGGSSGSNLSFIRYNDVGAQIDIPFSITRATGLTTLAAGSVVGNFNFGNSTGNPGIANTTLGGILGNAGPSDGGYISVSRDGGGGPALFVNVNNNATSVQFLRSGNGVGSISVTTTATAYNTSSDARLKTDLRTFDAGSILDAINPVDFAWKSTGERSHGVIAQEVQEIFPEAVSHHQDSWGIDYSKFVPLLLAEIKALRARVAALEAHSHEPETHPKRKRKS